MNIYIHFLSIVIFGTLLFPIYSKVYYQYINTQLGNIIIFLVFFQSIAIYFLLLASFYIILNYSLVVVVLSNYLDYLGIIILIQGLIIPSIYYRFYHELKLQKLYQLIAIILASTYIVTTLYYRFHYLNFRLYRAVIYSSLGLSTICFIIYSLILYS